MMASDTYYKEMWLRRNKTALQVVVVLLGVIMSLIVLQNLYRGQPSDSQGVVKGSGGKPEASVDKMVESGGYIRGRVIKDGDDFDPGDDDDDDAMNPDSVSDCCTIFDLWQPNHDDFTCSPLVEAPMDDKPLVCFYSEDPDNEKHAPYNAETATKIIQYLQEGGDSHGFIEVPAGVGVYSILVAAAHKNVLSVESDINNIKRFHKAAKLGRLERFISLLHNEVGDERASRAVADRQVKTIFLDDLPAFCKFRKAVMRLDLSGNEHRAFQHARFLFKELQITYVFLNWEKLKDKTTGQDAELMADMIGYFNKRGYVPRGYHGKVLSIKKWHQWPSDIYWQKM